MNQKSTNILRGRPWLMLLAVFAWLLSQKMAAAPYFVDDPSNYTVSLGGTNIVYFEAPAYDQGGLDMWINEGNLKVSVDGGAEYTIFQWKSPEGTLAHSATTCPTYFKTDTEGFFDITLGNSRSTSRLTKENPGNRTLQRNSDGATYSFSAEWVVPYNLLGKELKFIWDVKRDGNGYTLMTVPGLKTVTIKMPEANAKMTPFVSPAMLNNNNPGKLEVPWYIPADDLVKASYEYDDGYGKHHSVEIKDMKSGTIMLNANEPHRNFCLIVSYNEKGEKGTYLIENQKSDVQNIQMIHAPTGLTLTPSYGNNAKVELKWSIPYKDDEDLTPTDFFQIQRSLTGREEDFVTIFEQFYAKSHKNAVYTYTDSTLVEAIAERMLKDGGTLDNVTYRVRRGITKEWGWDNNCATTASCALDKMHLLRIADYTSRWEDERARTVRVSWDYAADRSAVWDERAEMKLLLLSRNRDGEQVDSTVITLNDTERQQRYTTVSVARSCVYYDIKVYVERGASPLPLFDDAKEYFFAIRNAQDWNTFRQNVTAAKGQPVNARLYTDISSSNSVGDADSPYCGIFDGNGHTLTVNIKHDSQYQAPFRYVGSAAFRNLHTAGTVSTTAQYAGGLMAHVLNGSKVTIDNCRSSMTINSTNRTNGGLISRLGDNVHALIRNSKFDGSFEGAESISNGGFIGYCQNNSSATIENCVFAPDHITTSHDYCQTWARGDGHTLNIINSYATQEYTPVTSASASSMTVDDLLNRLNNGWTQQDGVLVPVTTVKTLETNPTITTHTAADFKQYYHAANGKIEPTLMTQTRQSSVLLSWNTDGNPIDFYTVLRRNAGQGDDQWVVIATDLDQMSYEDTSVSPLLKYEYKVRAINQCEGRDSTETNVKAGECKHTGRVEGYVRFNDGTGAAGIQVEIEYNGTKVYATTDESGFYEADELAYQGKTSITYSVAPVAKGGVEFSPTGSTVTFDAHSNNVSMNEFTVINGMRFSGFVMYDGTSIPVKGANFEVDGQKVHSANGKLVETDHEGKFSFRVLPNTNLKIQAVMPGHTFTGDGYYKSPQGYTFTGDVANIYFYDATKVKLTGRVVGGNDQGQKPLMNNLSKNNLGDSLQIVLTLEGDNTSWLVYDNLNPNRSQREEVVPHQRGGDKHYTQVTTQRKRMVVTPDLTTGEYELQLPPVRWKVQQVYCKGYATLFQEGQVSEVIDLTNALDTLKVSYDGIYYDADENRVENPTAQYHAVYNRIYHSPVEVTYRQIGYDNFDYFGDKSYMATELTGKATEVPLVYSVRKPNWPANRKDSLMAVYTLGHPVFSIERRYNIQLQVGERYLYNNDPVGRVDLVPLKGGMAYMQNGMRGLSFDDMNTIKEYQLLDSLGRCVFTLKADQTSNMSDCLRTVTFTVERDSTYFEAEPLQAYVLNMYPIGSAKSILTEGQPLLFDILRDPPGAYSSNTLAKGATLNNTYMMNLTLMAGLNMTYKSGEDMQVMMGQMVGTAAAGAITGTVVGPISTGKFEEGSVDQLMYNAQGSKAFSHTMVLNNAVSTSGDPSMVGADADVYIGTVQNVVVTPMSSIRAVTHDMLKQMIARLGKDNIKLLSGTDVNSELEKYVSYGTVAVIASGLNADGDTIHLIRDVALGYGPEVQSQFFYSQKQILTQIIPDKAKEIADMMFFGTKEEAQAIANRTKKPVYLSLRLPTDSAFAVVNKPIEGHAYNTSIATPQEGINYLVVLPTGKEEKDFSDEIIEKYQVIKAWLEMIAQNEGEKLTARDLVANYDVAGTQGVNYSETFDNNYSTTWMNYFPIATEVDYFNTGSKELNQITSGVTLGITLAASIALSMQEMTCRAERRPVPLNDMCSVRCAMPLSDGSSCRVPASTAMPM